MQYHLPVFEALCPSWGENLHLGIRRVFSKGSHIFDLDARLDGVYLVHEGMVEVILYTENGPTRDLFFVGPGSIFGEVTCFVSGDSGEAYPVARTDCVLYFFSRETIETVIARQHPHLLVELVRASAYKIRMYTAHLKDALNGDHFIRVCKMLVYLARYKGVDLQSETQTVCLKPEMTQTDLARLMGIHRVTVTKAISRLKRMGLIRHFSKNRLEILDLPGLKRLVSEDDLQPPEKPTLF